MLVRRAQRYEKTKTHHSYTLSLYSAQYLPLKDSGPQVRLAVERSKPGRVVMMSYQGSASSCCGPELFGRSVHLRLSGSNVLPFLVHDQEHILDLLTT
ncbi:hypothetical protein EYF80_020655 [Liparis tanakae]|uniref:Uncharacterized protein n=1 Tax=Liparis tanakae TaxID=230148 RepID=A0A4Z2HVZ7_9TELE|nr:hypothetical protein EYF80_020655 [Liparis tanakae]